MTSADTTTTGTTPTTGTTTPVITTTGPVIGRVADGIAAYQGIPYAAPPFGERRFLAPRPHEPWTEPLEAFEFGPTAPQREGAAPGGLPDVIEPIIAGEEILNLNVWTTGSAGLRPVLVWIHGGGFFAGCSANPWYDGASFARQGLVVVSLNYRLGAEGFAELADAPSNRGLLDCIAALEWVRDNVAAFGGDPGRVTVMGQSAGGMAVACLLVSAAAEGLFRQAVIASGIAPVSAWPADQARAMTGALAKHAGVEATRAGLASRTPLELIDAHDAVVAEYEAAGTPLMPPWGPVVDGDVVAGQFLDAVRAGRGAAVPVLTGTTKNEFAWRGFRDQPDSAQARRQGQRQFADDFFRHPTQAFAEARVATGAAPTYRYEFGWESTAAPYILAGHSIDIPFFFNNLGAPYVREYTGPNPPQELADFDHHAFASFATTGNPGWPPFSAGSAVMIIDNEPHLTPGIDFDA
jgi:para-nitrobenzyl esterase